MASNYTCKVLIEAPRDAVYDALTSAVGLQNWWTTTCEVGKRVGAESTFRFGQTFNVMHRKIDPGAETIGAASSNTITHPAN